MNHEDMPDLLCGYALDALDDAERDRVAQHLRLCLPCQIAAHADRAVADQLAFAAPQHRPPPGLKARLMSRVEGDRVAGRPAAQRVLRVPRWLMAAAVLPWLAVVGLGAAMWMSVQGQPAPALVVDHISGPQGELGRLAMLPHESIAFLMLTHMPALRPGRVYVCWLERHGTMERVSTFRLMKHSDDATVVLHPAHTMDTYTAVDITAEQHANASHPTGTLLARGRL